MSVCKYRAFIFLDQPPPWPSRTVHILHTLLSCGAHLTDISLDTIYSTVHILHTLLSCGAHLTDISLDTIYSTVHILHTLLSCGAHLTDISLDTIYSTVRSEIRKTRLLKYWRTVDSERLGEKIKDVTSTFDIQSVLNTPTEGVFFPLGQETSPHCCCFQEKVHWQQHPAFSAFAYSPGFALVDFFLFWRVKEELMNLSLGRHNLKETLVGVIRTFTND